MASLQEIENHLQELTKTFRQIEELIESQYQAVVDHKLEKLNELADQQIELHGNLQNHEDALQTSLKNQFDADHPKLKNKQVRLSNLIEALDLSDTQIPKLRQDLLEQITQTQKRQNQLNELLLFASNHVTDTLKGIYDLGKKHDKRYTPRGTTSSNEGSFINRTG